MSLTFNLFILLKVEDGSPEYPRSSGKWWFGCDESSKLLKADRPHEDDQDADLIDAGKSLFVQVKCSLRMA